MDILDEFYFHDESYTTMTLSVVYSRDINSDIKNMLPHFICQTYDEFYDLHDFKYTVEELQQFSNKCLMAEYVKLCANIIHTNIISGEERYN